MVVKGRTIEISDYGVTWTYGDFDKPEAVIVDGVEYVPKGKGGWSKERKGLQWRILELEGYWENQKGIIRVKRERIKELEAEVERLQQVADELDKELFDIPSICKPKHEPLTESQVSKILSDARAAVKAGTMTGIEASLLKWDTLMQYTEETGRVHPEWRDNCGLCVERDVDTRDCRDCPIAGCGHTRDWKDMMIVHKTCPPVWLHAARRFRTWIKDTYDAWLAKQKPQDDWVYTIRKSRSGYALYTPAGCVWGGVPKAKSEVVEELIPLLLEEGINIATLRKYCTSDSYMATPLFGVRKLREGEGPSLEMASDDYVCAFYEGKRIIEAWERIEDHSTITDAANKVIERLLKRLTPAKTTPAITLADLDVKE